MMPYIKCSAEQSHIYVSINTTETVNMLAEMKNTTWLVYLPYHQGSVATHLEGTSGGFIAVLYFKRIFTVEPKCLRVALIVGWDLPQLPATCLLQRKQGVPEKRSPELGAHVCGLCTKHRWVGCWDLHAPLDLLSQLKDSKKMKMIKKISDCASAGLVAKSCVCGLLQPHAP